MHFTQKLTPFLSFQSEAEEAANLYVSLLPDSRIVQKVYNPHSGDLMTVEFELAGMNYVALNTGQAWEHTGAFSMAVSCQSQAEIDQLWDALLASGGEPLACGWLKDKFGVRWQIVPAPIGQMMADPDATKAKRVFDAMVKMIKMDMATIQAAYDG